VRRRTLVLVVVLALVAAGAVSGWFAARSSGGVTGLCASATAGLKERNLPKIGIRDATIVLTNFRFGRIDDFYGLAAGRRWPAGGITIAVSNEGPDSTPPLRRALQVTRADFKGFEGDQWPTANVAVRSQGRILDAYAEVRTVAPAAIATVNRALANVRACHA
jgi:hypothetical protein